VADIETRLQHAFAADALPATDPQFRVQVIMRRQRAALRRWLAEVLGFVCVSAVVAVLALQAVNEIVESANMRVIITIALAVGYMVVFTRRYLEVPSFVHVWGVRVKSVIWRY
jgi:hypothetical protein